MTTFDETRGYAGASPGQNLASLADRLTVRDLQLIVGERVLPLLPVAAQRDKSVLGTAALRTLRDRPRSILGDRDLRKTVLRNLDPGKLDELKFRMVRSGVATTPKDVDFDTVAGQAAWSVLEGFFGLEPDETATGARPLPRQALSPRFGLFQHQRSVVRRTYALVGAGHGRTLIHMPTGAGKTRTAMHLVARFLNENEPCVVTWLATSRELLEQAAETFESAWAVLGNRELTQQRFWGDYATSPDELEDGILIGGLAKMHAWRARHGTAFLRFSARTRLVIMDEAHQAIAPTYRAVIDGLADAGQSDALVGLTATPGRTWNDVGLDEQLSDFFGGSKVALEVSGYNNPVEYLLNEGYLAKPCFKQLTYTPDSAPTSAELQKLTKLDDFSEEMLEAFAANNARNLAILDGIQGLLQRGHRRIILFAVSVRHAEDLAAALTAYGVESSVVSGETALGRRAATLKTFKSGADRPMVLCNFGVLTTGFDAPKTSAAIIARPTKSLVLFSQMVGRATRGPKAGGNATCEILTVHDPAYPGFGDIAEAFFNWEDVWNDSRV